jgi:anti-anti-sigma factor
METGMLSFVIEDWNDVVTITIKGELHHEKIAELENVWNDQLRKPAAVIAINCVDLKFIDSPAIGALVKFFNEAMKKGKKLVFYDLSPTIRQLFDTSRLERLFVITSRHEFEEKYLKKQGGI